MKKFESYIWLKITPRLLELWERGLISPRFLRIVLAEILDVEYEEKRFPYGLYVKLQVPKKLEEVYNSLDQSQRETLAQILEHEVYSYLLDNALSLKGNGKKGDGKKGNGKKGNGKK